VAGRRKPFLTLGTLLNPAFLLRDFAQIWKNFQKIPTCFLLPRKNEKELRLKELRDTNMNSTTPEERQAYEGRTERKE
jgi:hypothetical protein